MEAEIKPKVGRYIYLSDEIDKSLRVCAAIEDRSFSAVVEEALRNYLPNYKIEETDNAGNRTEIKA